MQKTNLNYEIMLTPKGYQIRKPDGLFWIYLCRVSRGRYLWVADCSYAKHFCLDTAKKHVRKLQQMMEDVA